MRRWPAALLLGCALCAARAQTCAPPEELKAKMAAPTAEALADLGAWFGAHEQYGCAVQALATSLQMDPAQKDLSHVVFLFGASLYFSGDVKDAIAALQQAETLGYRNAGLHALLGTALDGQRAYAAAAAEWRKVLAFEPEQSAALDALSNDLMATRDFAAVVALLEAPRVVPQRTARQLLNLAAAYEALGNAERAIATLEDGWNTYPDSREIAAELEEQLKKAGRVEEAGAVGEVVRTRGEGQRDKVTE